MTGYLLTAHYADRVVNILLCALGVPRRSKHVSTYEFVSTPRPTYLGEIC